MTRENKLALVVGFGLILFVGILISDHFSVARNQASANLMNRRIDDPLVSPPRNDPDLIALKPEPTTPPLLQAGEPAVSTATISPRDATALESMTPEQRSMINRTVYMGESTTIDRPRDVQPVDTLAPRNGSSQLTMGNNSQAQDIELPGFVRVEGEQPVRASDVRFHDVQGGESMYAICKRYYGTTELVAALAKFNKLDDAASLREGRRLLIPPADAIGGKVKTSPTAKPRESGSSALKPTAVANNAPKTSGKTYTVKPGDSLSGIAQRVLGDRDRWPELHKLNKKVIDDPDKLKTGIVLKLG